MGQRRFERGVHWRKKIYQLGQGRRLKEFARSKQREKEEHCVENTDFLRHDVGNKKEKSHHVPMCV